MLSLVLIFCIFLVVFVCVVFEFFVCGRDVVECFVVCGLFGCGEV